MVLVLDRHKKPLMPCTPKRARLLLARGRAVVHRVVPFVIRLRDRDVEDSALQPLALKIDPGSRTTGMALARVEMTSEGEVHHAVYLSEVAHRGEQVHQNKQTQANARRRRRSANLRHRAPRFDNRAIPPGWLAPRSSPGSATSSPGPIASLNGLPSAVSRSSGCASTRTCSRIQKSRGWTTSTANWPGGRREPICFSSMTTDASTVGRWRRPLK